MNFENALCAMRKGYKVQRKSLRNRLNAICLYIENGFLISEQTHELSMHKKEQLTCVSERGLMASDWEVLK